MGTPYPLPVDEILQILFGAWQSLYQMWLLTLWYKETLRNNKAGNLRHNGVNC